MLLRENEMQEDDIKQHVCCFALKITRMVSNAGIISDTLQSVLPELCFHSFLSTLKIICFLCDHVFTRRNKCGSFLEITPYSISGN